MFILGKSLASVSLVYESQVVAVARHRTHVVYCGRWEASLWFVEVIVFPVDWGKRWHFSLTEVHLYSFFFNKKFRIKCFLPLTITQKCWNILKLEFYCFFYASFNFYLDCGLSSLCGEADPSLPGHVLCHLPWQTQADFDAHYIYLKGPPHFFKI